MKNLFFTLLFFISSHCFSQYIAVRAKYTETRTVDNTPNAPSRENRLILSFYQIGPSGEYIPATLSNYDIWVYKEGMHYSTAVLDSTGNNYPGYAWTAPKAIAYYNSYGPNYIDCNPFAASHYVVNGHQLDCGFIRVSHWEPDESSSLGESERFTAPNVSLPYYIWPEPYALVPGNLNFEHPYFPSLIYDWYNFACPNSTLQLIIRGQLPADSNGSTVVLPVRFANVRASLVNETRVKIEWSNLTESDINYYEVQRSSDGQNFQTIGLVFPLHNNGGRADYTFFDPVTGSGSFYYCIKALENSGIVLYSHILRITNSTTSKTVLTVHPNPISNGQLNFQVSNLPAGKYTALLVNMAGQVKFLKIIDHPGGSFSQSQHLSSPAAGMYQFILRSADQQYSQKVFIHH